MAVVSTRHPLSACETIEVGHLGTHAVMVGTGFASRLWFETACHNAHFRPNVVLESAAPHSVIALARNDFVIAVLPSSVEVNDRRVGAVPLIHRRRRAIGRWATAAWNSQHYLPPYAERFIEGLAKHRAQGYSGRTMRGAVPPLPRPA